MSRAEERHKNPLSVFSVGLLFTWKVHEIKGKLDGGLGYGRCRQIGHYSAKEVVSQGGGDGDPCNAML